MSQTDTSHAWWSRLRHQGLLLSPVVMIERFPDAPPTVPFYTKERLRDAKNRFSTKLGESEERDQAAVLAFVDTLLENFVGHPSARLVKQHSIPEKYTVAVRIGSRSDTLRPHRILFADEKAETSALLFMADSSPHVGRGRGRTVYSRFLELLRGTGHRLGLLTNGQQFRLVYAGLDFESWCEWETDRWFDDGEGTEELLGLRQLLSPESLKPVKEGVSGLLDAVEESRKRQADLSSVLRENVRQAVELLLEEVSTANRLNAELFTLLIKHDGDRTLTDAEAHEALLQATVRVVMRLVVCLFAESRHMLPVNDPIYTQSYGVRTLYELLDKAARLEGGTHALFNRESAWPRLMALFRLVHAGSSHGAFPLRSYGGALFRPGDQASPDPVARALHILEHSVSVGDDKIYSVLRKLLRGPLPVLRGRSKTFVEGPVDYTDLRTEFIGLIYEGLLDYRLKRTDEEIGPQVFLNLGREPVLPLSRLTDMLANDRKGLKDLLTTLRKEKVTASASSEEEEETEEATDDSDQAEEESTEELTVETEETTEVKRTGDYMDAVEAATSWAKEAVVLAGLVSKQARRETDSEYQTRIEVEAKKLINRVVATGEFYLVRAGNTRKGTGTFYTRPQLAVPTTHRTLQPLCYEKDTDATLIPKTPEEILGLKVCDPACGSASFLVAALHYLTEALYKSLCHHKKLDDPVESKKIVLPFGRPRMNTEADQLVPFPPDDPQRGQIFEERVQALLRRHVVERCIYGVDINPLAVEFARVSLWVETLDPELPFSFLDHKIKVGNSLVGCWLDRVQDYPIKAWEREGGDGPQGERSQRIEEFLKGPKVGNRRTGDGKIKQEMRQVIESKFSNQPPLFPEMKVTTESVVSEARAEYEKLHDLPVGDPDEREGFYRDHIQNSPMLRTLKAAMDEWCAIWFWPTDRESLRHVPTPLSFHEPLVAKDSIVKQLAAEVKFFHWELEFPDVFSPERNGFDSVLGNPPWETLQQESLAFFSDVDPLYRTYSNKTAKKKQLAFLTADPTLQARWTDYCVDFISLIHWTKAVAVPFDVPLARGAKERSLLAAWSTVRQHRPSTSSTLHPFSMQGTGKSYTYKLFLEISHCISNTHGGIGQIVPAGIYAEKGAKAMRRFFSESCNWEWLFAFRNKRRLFNVHADTRFACIVVHKGGQSDSIRTRFRIEDPSEWERSSPPSIAYTVEMLRLFSPKALSFIEARTDKELALNIKVYSHSHPLAGHGDAAWAYGREYNTTDDVSLLRAQSELCAEGYEFDRFGRLISANGDFAYPVLQGVMVDAFDCSGKAFASGDGVADGKWLEQRSDMKHLRARFYMTANDLSKTDKSRKGLKIVAPKVTNPENGRTMYACLAEGVPSIDSVNTAQFLRRDDTSLYCVLAVMNSLVFDFALRTRMAGLNLNPFVILECPYPAHVSHKVLQRLFIASIRLCGNILTFAPQWLKGRRHFPELQAREWKHWWAVTESDRLRLRVESEALCADLYGLCPDDFDWIVRDDPSDPKGFWRVDKQLPYRERLTGLGAAAFRALKEGKWSAESAASLSNDEFFEILGIPELTNADAAKAEGLTGPLILKRDGCHVWKPENYPEDDRRHGWTWDDCWQDAVALLGSEDAVRKYIEGDTPVDAAEPESGDGKSTGSKDLFGNPIPKNPKQTKMF